MNALLAAGLVPLYIGAAWVRWKAIRYNGRRMRPWFFASIALALVLAGFYVATVLLGSSTAMISIGRSLSYLSVFVVWIGTPAASTWRAKHPTDD